MKGFVSSLLLLFVQVVFAEAETTYHLKSQYAGEIGYISVGGGAKFKDYISVDVLYGVVPDSMNTEKIETIAIKNHYDLTKFELNHTRINPYLGLSVFHVLGKKYKTSQDEKYPNNYYPEASVRGYFFWGLELEPSFSGKNSFYYEMGINDIWLVNYYNNSDVIDIRDHISLGLGWNYKI